MPFNLTELLQ